MSVLVLVVRLLLVGVFALAGVAKLMDRSGSRQAFVNFGVPTALAAPLAIFLPLAELAVAVGLLPASTALWGAIGALALVLLFVAGIAINLVRGRKPDCHCFGQLYSAPIGRKTLARNGVLAVLAGFLVWQGWEGNAGPSAVAWIVALSTLQLLGLFGGIVVLGLLVGQWWFLMHLLRQNGRLLVRLEALEEGYAAGGAEPARNDVAPLPHQGLPIGAQAPNFSLDGLYGETLTLDSLHAGGKLVVLIFADPDCGPCTAMLPEIGRWQKEHARELSIALISQGTTDENKVKMTKHGVTAVLLQKNWEVSDAYQIWGTPSALLVRPDGTIGSPVVGGGPRP